MKMEIKSDAPEKFVFGWVGGGDKLMSTDTYREMLFSSIIGLELRSIECNQCK